MPRREGEVFLLGTAMGVNPSDLQEQGAGHDVAAAVAPLGKDEARALAESPDPRKRRPAR